MDTQVASGGQTAPVWQGMEKLYSHPQGAHLLEIILADHSRPHPGRKSPVHIIWATDDYLSHSPSYQENEHIPISAVDGSAPAFIQPRAFKTKEEQQARARDKGEVFTSSWICNAQNNLIDSEWFGTASPFNTEADKGWTTNKDKIIFPTKDGKTWLDYVKEIRMEIACGEAPYLISRYDAITGEAIPVSERIGLLDRKLRIVTENAASEGEWYASAKHAYQAIYGYEWQGDNLFLARANALLTYFDYFEDHFRKDPPVEYLTEIAEIISWNFWQMDGLKGVIPNSCHEDIHIEPSLFGDGDEVRIPCKGCETDDIRRHNGIYCKIMDWENGKPIRFIDLIKT